MVGRRVPDRTSAGGRLAGGLRRAGRCGLTLCTLLWCALAAAQDNAGGISGTVRDPEFDLPLDATSVWVPETNAKTETDDTGHFTLHGLGPGVYTVVAAKAGFDRVVRSGVLVAPGAMTTIEITMTAQYTEMEELVVRPLDLRENTATTDDLRTDLKELGSRLAEEIKPSMPVEVELLSLRADTAGIVDAVGKEMISRAGAGSAAEAVKLVAGVTVASDKYAVIRGLSDRFVNTRVNGIAVPTADPDVRAVQLDLFPSALLESVRVYKTFTPDLPGNTSGGSVDIVTPDVPDKLTFETKVGTGYNTQATGNHKFLTSGQRFAYFGLDEGPRRQTLQNGDVTEAGLPPPRPRYNPDSPSPEWQEWLPKARQQEAQTRGLSSVYGPTRDAPPPNHNWGLTYGDSLKLAPETRLGWLSAWTYSSKYTHEEGVKHELFGSTDLSTFARKGSDAGTTYPDQWDTEASRHTVGWGFGQVLQIKSEDHSVKLNYLRTQQTDEKALNYWDDHSEPGNHWRNQSLIYTARSMESLQLLGVTPLGLLDCPELRLGLRPGIPRLEWALARSQAVQDQPDQRFFLAQYNANQGYWGIASNRDKTFNQRSWRTIDEGNHYYSADLVWPFETGEENQGQVKTGWSLEDTERSYSQDTFYYASTNSPYAVSYGPFDTSWSAAFLEPQRLGYPVLNSGTDFDLSRSTQTNWTIAQSGDDLDYDGTLRVPAYYGMAEVPASQWLKFVGGARVEKTSMTTQMHAANQNPAGGGDDQVLVLDMRGYLQGLETGGSQFVQFTNAQEARRAGRQGETLSSLADASLEQTDLLPSLGFVLDVVGYVKLRGTWSRTVGRPTFKELTPVSQQDHIGAQPFAGNPTLRISQLTNYDLRLEWNPGDGRLLSASGFQKDIVDPIDYSSRPTTYGANSNYVIPFNYPEGEITGFELEGREELGRYHPSLQGLCLGSSFTWVDATVTLPEADAKALKARVAQAGKNASSVGERRMKDQPEYLISLYTMYDIAPTGTSLGLFLVQTGEALVAGEDGSGQMYTPNRVKKPLTSLDFSISQKVFKESKLTLSIANLLDPLVKEVWQSDHISAGEATASSYRKGRTISLGFSTKW